MASLSLPMKTMLSRYACCPIPWLLLALPIAVPGAAPAQVDGYWQRNAMVQPHPLLKPFRQPTTIEDHKLPRGPVLHYWQKLEYFRGLAQGAQPSQRSYDKTGREVVDLPAWRDALAEVQKLGFKLEGHVAEMMRSSSARSQRNNAAYGMFYFTDPQPVIHMISQLAAEPDEEIRRSACARGLQFLRVHLPESKPLRPDQPNGAIVPRYQFNPYGFFELCKRKEPHLAAEGLAFLAEVLRARPDLGRCYLEQLRDAMPQLISSDAELVRLRAAEFLEAVVVAIPGQRPAGLTRPDQDALSTEFRLWWERVDHALFPPIRHVSSGRTLLFPSKDRDQLVEVGRELLAKKDVVGPPADGKLITGQYYRGVRILALPTPLDQLGIKKGATITHVATIPVADSVALLKVLQERVDLYHQRVKVYEEYLKDFNAKAKPGQQPRPAPTLVIEVEFVVNGKSFLKDFVWM